MEQERKWNIFARVLEETLTAHGVNWYWLQSRLGVHRETVRRLQQSLREPAWNTLSPVMVDKLMDALILTREERNRLRIALLATAVEQLLMGRDNPDITPRDVLHIAEEVFDSLLKAIQEKERMGEKSMMGAVRKGSRAMSNDNLIASKLERVLAIYDRAMISLHLSFTATWADEQVVESRYALTGFESASAILDKLDEETKSSAEWQEWFQEVQEGLNAAKERLAELDALP